MCKGNQALFNISYKVQTLVCEAYLREGEEYGMFVFICPRAEDYARQSGCSRLPWFRQCYACCIRGYGIVDSLSLM